MLSSVRLSGDWLSPE